MTSASPSAECNARYLRVACDGSAIGDGRALELTGESIGLAETQGRSPDRRGRCSSRASSWAIKASTCGACLLTILRGGELRSFGGATRERCGGLVRAAELPVEAPRQRGQADQQDRGADPVAAARRRRLAGLAIGRIGRQHAPFDLEPSGLRLRVAEHPALPLARQLGELRPVDPQIVVTTARRRPDATHQRRHHQPDGNQRHRAKRKPQAHPAAFRRHTAPCIGRDHSD